MADTKRQVIERIDELVVALAHYQERAGREVELIVRADGSSSLMGQEMPLGVACADGGFEELDQFSDFAGLAEVLFGVELAVQR